MPSMQIRKFAVFVISLLLPALGRAEEERPLLTIGSRAPELQIEHWLSTGGGRFQPVKNFEPGQVYLVEFWATWCGPCIGSMPHLAALQEKYSDQGVQIISISDETPNEIGEFLKLPAPVAEGAVEQTYGELNKGYCLATDPDRSVYRDYMEASGQLGIPRAYLVGKTGEIEWIGHPLNIDKALKEVLDDTWDRKAFLTEFTHWQLWGVLQSRVSKLVQEGEYDAARALYAKERISLADRLREKPLLVEQIQEYETELEEEILLAPAIREYKARNYEKCSEELAKALVSANRHSRTRIHHIGFDSEMKLKRYDRAEKVLAAAKADAAIKTAAPIDDMFSINVLNGMCWATYEAITKPESQVPASLKSAALAGAEQAFQLAPDDNPILDTLAHLLAISGDLDRAIELEARAYDRETHAETKNEFRRELEVMKARKAEVAK